MARRRSHTSAACLARARRYEQSAAAHIQRARVCRRSLDRYGADNDPGLAFFAWEWLKLEVAFARSFARSARHERSMAAHIRRMAQFERRHGSVPATNPTH